MGYTAESPRQEMRLLMRRCEWERYVKKRPQDVSSLINNLSFLWRFRLNVGPGKLVWALVVCINKFVDWELQSGSQSNAQRANWPTSTSTRWHRSEFVPHKKLINSIIIGCARPAHIRQGAKINRLSTIPAKNWFRKLSFKREAKYFGRLKHMAYVFSLVGNSKSRTWQLRAVSYEWGIVARMAAWGFLALERLNFFMGYNFCFEIEDFIWQMKMKNKKKGLRAENIKQFYNFSSQMRDFIGRLKIIKAK